MKKKILVVSMLILIISIGSCGLILKKSGESRREIDFRLFGDSKNEKVKNLTMNSFNYYFSNDYKSALVQINEALEIEPENRALLYHSARLKLRTSEKEEGMNQLRKIAIGNDKFSVMAKEIITNGDGPNISF